MLAQPGQCTRLLFPPFALSLLLLRLYHDVLGLMSAWVVCAGTCCHTRVDVAGWFGGFAQNTGCILADFMGLGKTMQVISSLQVVFGISPETRRLMVDMRFTDNRTRPKVSRRFPNLWCGAPNPPTRRCRCGLLLQTSLEGWCVCVITHDAYQ